MSDAEYDARFRELARLEARGDVAAAADEEEGTTSPTQTVGFASGGEQFAHATPMLSLANTYDPEGIALKSRSLCATVTIAVACGAVDRRQITDQCGCMGGLQTWHGLTHACARQSAPRQPSLAYRA